MYSTSCGVSTRATTVNDLPPAWTMRRFLGRHAAGDTGDRDGLLAGEAVAGGILAGQELQRQDAHADEVGAVDALEAPGDHGADAEQQGALRGPVARAAATVELAGDDDERDAVGGVLHGGVVDRELLGAPAAPKYRV